MQKQTLQQLIAAGNIGQAMQQLLQTTASDKDLQQEVLTIAARFAHYEKQLHGNTADAGWLSTERNQINAALLYVIEKLPDDASIQNNEVPQSEAKTVIQNADKIYNINHIDNANFS